MKYIIVGAAFSHKVDPAQTTYITTGVPGINWLIKYLLQ